MQQSRCACGSPNASWLTLRCSSSSPSGRRGPGGVGDGGRSGDCTDAAAATVSTPPCIVGVRDGGGNGGGVGNDPARRVGGGAGRDVGDDTGSRVGGGTVDDVGEGVYRNHGRHVRQCQYQYIPGEVVFASWGRIAPGYGARLPLRNCKPGTKILLCAPGCLTRCNPKKNMLVFWRLRWLQG